MGASDEPEPRWSELLRAVQSSVPDESGPHSNRVGAVAEALYRAWASRHDRSADNTDKVATVVRQAAMLHDVGKRCVPAELLGRATGLTDHEFAIIRTHTIEGAAFFAEAVDPVEVMAYVVCLRHHERWDGGGYPGRSWDLRDSGLYPDVGLIGEEIPFFARVVALADVYDALLSKRAYKEPWPESDVLEHIRAQRGRHFDPLLVDVFFEAYEDIRRARESLI